jgi:ABC-2 type transport system ATP-binding protein
VSDVLRSTASLLETSAPPVVAEGLVKRYGRRSAVDGVTFTVGAGETVGLLGPNGAGKTTTVKMLLGLVRPTAGTAALFGAPAVDPAARRRVGYLPEQFRFPPWLTGAGLLDLHGRLVGLDRDRRAAQAAEVLELVGLAGREGDRIGGYSKGMQQRIGLAQALMGHPALVILDEPTSALDPIGRRDVRDVVRALRDRGTAVVLNSHLLSEVEMVCDRVVIVDRGRVVRSGRLDELAGGALELRIRLDRIDARALDLLGGHGEVVAHEGDEVLVTLDDPGAVADLSGELVAAGYGLLALVPLQRTLEEVFVELVGREERR